LTPTGERLESGEPMSAISHQASDRIARVRKRLAKAKNVMVITGAGVSAESGIPTFRDDKGLWKEFNPEEYATREAFERDAAKVWKWYDDRRVKMAQAKPNPAHLALAAMAQNGRRAFVVTQNVDDLHERAGSKEVVHVHGSLWRIRCERDGTVLENREAPLSEVPPLCACGEVMRPDVVWFGEGSCPNRRSTGSSPTCLRAE